MKILVVLNDPAYGTERSYNGLRLAHALAKREEEQVRIFLLADAVTCALAGQHTPGGYYDLERMLTATVSRGRGRALWHLNGRSRRPRGSTGRGCSPLESRRVDRLGALGQQGGDVLTHPWSTNRTESGCLMRTRISALQRARTASQPLSPRLVQAAARHSRSSILRRRRVAATHGPFVRRPGGVAVGGEIVCRSSSCRLLNSAARGVASVAHRATVMRDKPNLAREVNAHILALEARLDDESFLARDPYRHLIGFFCECGCGQLVALTRADYEANGGAWLEGHGPHLAA